MAGSLWRDGKIAEFRKLTLSMGKGEMDGSHDFTLGRTSTEYGIVVRIAVDTKGLREEGIQSCNVDDLCRPGQAL
jgi:hypothetical protein